MGKYGRCLYECIFAVPLSLGILLFCYPDIGLESAGKLICFYAILYCAACAFLVYLKGKDRLLAIGTTVVFLGVPAGYGLLMHEKDFFYTHRYIWLIPAISAGCFLVGFLCKKLRVFRYLTAIGVIASLVAFLVLGYHTTKLCVMLFLCVLVLLLADETQVMWHKKGRTDHALHLTFVAPFIYAWLFICLLFPVSKSPYGWNIVKNLWNMVNNMSISFMQWTGGKSDDFTSYQPGFSESSRISGDKVNESRKVLLIVEPVMGNPVSFRLAGEACDTFKNMRWENTIKEDTRELEFDTLETRATMEKVRKFSDYMQPLELRVTYRNFSTRHLFVPDKVTVRGTTLSALNASAKGANILYDKKKGVNNQYLISGYRVNLLHPEFADFVNNAEPVTEADWTHLVSRADVSKYASSYEHFLEYRDRIRTQYIHSVTLSDYTKEFVAAATEGAETPFERMLMLGKALNSFDYSASPGQFPSYVKDASSFLDYFLSVRRGYCAHFATAMTLLAWSEGLPARYVHGFSVTVNDRSSVDVIADNAHAWCEIYFENIGWIPFDVTPGFNRDMYWETSSDRSGRVWDNPSPTSSAPTPLVLPTEEPEAKPFPIRQVLLLTGFAVAFLIVFTVIVLISDRIITLHRFNRLSDEDKIPVLYRRNQRLLSYLGLSMKKEETLAEYHDRIAASLPKRSVAWLPAYEQYLYGKPDDIGPLVSSMKTGNKALLKEFRTQSPRRYRLCAIGNRLIR